MGTDPPSLSDQVLQVVFALYCLTFVVVLIFLLFFSNRFIAFIVSKSLNIYLWRSRQASLELDSLRISVFGGCVVFKKLEYVTDDYVLRIEGGSVTFHYWLPRVKPPGDDSFGPGSSNIPSRFSLVLDGVEWFVFNHTEVWHEIARKQRRKQARNTSRRNSEEILTSRQPQSGIQMVDLSEHTGEVERDDDDDDENLEPENPGPVAPPDPKIPFYLPVDIEILKGAIVVGNPALETLLCLSFRSAKGIYTALDAPSELDIYQTVSHLNFMHAKVKLLTNFDFQEGKRFKPYTHQRQPDSDSAPPREGSSGSQEDTPYGKHNKERKAATHLKAFLADLRINFADLDQLETRAWKGLERYETKENYYEEYARVETVLETEVLNFRYLVDVPGLVPADPSMRASTDPTWELNLQFQSTTLNYGPWADRQRFLLQSFYYPFDYRELPISEPTPAGQLRIFPTFVLKINFLKDTTWRIPMREASKDHLFEGPKGGPKWAFRKYAWMDFKFAAGSIHYKLPMTTVATGYTPTLNLSFSDLIISTSLNYATMATVPTLQVDLSIRNPRLWSQRQNWNYLITMDSPNIFFLRDHVNLFMDLVADLTTAPPTPYAFFVPSVYSYSFRVTNFKTFLNVNEGNIIGQADALDDNVYVVLNVPEGSALVTTPFLSYQPSSTKVSINVDAKNPRVSMSLPKSHTVGAFLADHSDLECISADTVSLNGSYIYYQLVAPGNVDTFNLNLDICKARVVARGYFLHHIIFLKENYFGIKLNFTTVEEYRAGHEESGDVGLLFREKRGISSSTTKEDHDTSILLESSPSPDSPFQLPSKKEGSGKRKTGSKDQGGPSVSPAENGSSPSTSVPLNQPPAPPALASNIFEFNLLLFVKDGVALLPSEMFSLDNALMVSFATLELDVRYLPIFVDLALNLSPVTLSSIQAAEMSQDPHRQQQQHHAAMGGKIGKRQSRKSVESSLPSREFSSEGSTSHRRSRPDRMKRASSKLEPSAVRKTTMPVPSLADARVVIENFGLVIHMMFGPAPEELTYHNSIRVQLGKILGNLTPFDVDCLLNFGNSFPFQLVNIDNRLKSYPGIVEPIPDYLELDLVVECVRLGIVNGLDFQRKEPQFEAFAGSMMLLSLPNGLHVGLNTLMTPEQSSRIEIFLPLVTLGFYLPVPDQPRDSEPAFSGDSDATPEKEWVEVGSLEFSFSVVIVPRRSNAALDAIRQKNFIKDLDRETFRCCHFYEEEDPVQQQSQEATAAATATATKRKRVKPSLSKDLLLGDLLRQPSFSQGIASSPSLKDSPAASDGVSPILRNLSRHASKIDSAPSPLALSLEDKIAEAFSPSSKGIVKSVSTISSRKRVATDDSDNESFFTASDRSQSIYSFDAKDPEALSDSESYFSDTEQVRNPDDADGEEEEEEEEEEDEDDFEDDSGDLEPLDGSDPIPVPVTLRSRLKRQQLYPYLGVPSVPRYKSYLNHTTQHLLPSFSANNVFNYPLILNSPAGNPKEVADLPTHKGPATNTITVLEDVTSEAVFIRVQAQSPVNVFLTPLIFQVCEEAIDSVNSQGNSLNAMLDSLQADYVKRISQVLGTQLFGTHLELAVEKIALHGIQEIVSPLPNQISETRSSVLLFEKAKSRMSCVDAIIRGTNLSFSTAILKVIDRPERRFPLYPHVRSDEIAELAIETRVDLAMESASLVVRYAKEASSENTPTTTTTPPPDPSAKSSTPPLSSIPADRVQGDKIYGDRISTFDIPVIAQVYLGPVMGNFVLEKPPEEERSRLYLFAEKSLRSREESSSSPSSSTPPTVNRALKANLVVSSADLTVLDQFLEVCLGVVNTWELFMEALVRNIEPFLSLPLLQKRILVAQLAQLSAGMRGRKNPPSILTAPSRPSMSNRTPYVVSQSDDPPFLIKPSNMWRLGKRPHQNDDGWKLVAHLRFCFQQAQERDLERITELLSTARRLAFQKLLQQSPDLPRPGEDSPLFQQLFNPDTLFIEVLDHLWNWRHWERDELTSSPFLTMLYDQPIASTGLLLNSIVTSSGSAFAHLGQISVNLLTATGVENRITFFPTQLRGQSFVAKSEEEAKSTQGQNRKVTKQTIRVQGICHAQGLSLDITSDMVQTLEHLLRGVSTYIAAKATFASEKNWALASSTTRSPLQLQKLGGNRSGLDGSGSKLSSPLTTSHSPPSPSIHRPHGFRNRAMTAESEPDQYPGENEGDHRQSHDSMLPERSHLLYQHQDRASETSGSEGHDPDDEIDDGGNDGDYDEDGHEGEKSLSGKDIRSKRPSPGLLLHKQSSKPKIQQVYPPPLKASSSRLHGLVFKTTSRNEEYQAIDRTPQPHDDLNEMELGHLKPPSDLPYGSGKPAAPTVSTNRSISGGSMKPPANLGRGPSTLSIEPPIAVGSPAFLLEPGHRFEYDYDVHMMMKMDQITAVFDIHNLCLELKFSDLSASLMQQPPRTMQQLSSPILSPAAPISPLPPTLPHSVLSLPGSTATTVAPSSGSSTAPFLQSLPAVYQSPVKKSKTTHDLPDVRHLSSEDSEGQKTPTEISQPSVISPLPPPPAPQSPPAPKIELQSVTGAIGGIHILLTANQRDLEGNPISSINLLGTNVGHISVITSLEKREIGPSYEPLIRATMTCSTILVDFTSPLMVLYQQLERLQGNSSLHRQLKNIAAELALTQRFMESPKSRLSASQMAKSATLPHPEPPMTKLPRRILLQSYLRELHVDILILPTLKSRYTLAKPCIEMARHRVDPPSVAPANPAELKPRVSAFETDFSLSLSKQSFSFFLVKTSGKPGSEATETKLFKFNVPSMKLIGSLRPVPETRQTSFLTVSIMVEKVDIKLRDQMLETLLSAQRVLGSEVADILRVLKPSETPAEDETPTKPSSLKKPPTAPQATSATHSHLEPNFLFKVDVLLKGIKLELLAPVAAISLESGVVKAHLRSHPFDIPRRPSEPPVSWNCILKGLSLFLEEKTLADPSLPKPKGNESSVSALGSSTVAANSPARLASVVIDLSLQNYPPKSEKFAQFASRLGMTDQEALGVKQSFFVTLPRAHGVLQSVAVDLITDVFLFHQKKIKDFFAKQRQFAHDLPVRTKTKTLLRSVNKNLKKINQGEAQSNFLEHRLIFVHLSNFAAAIPMIERTSTTQAAGAPDSLSTRPAFLLSATDVILSSRKGEASALEIIGVSVKFADRFDAQDETHFHDSAHPVINCAVLPSIFCQVVISTRKSPAKAGRTSPPQEDQAIDRTRVSIEGRVSGIEVDTDIRVASHIADLNEIFQMNKARMVKLLDEAFQQEERSLSQDRLGLATESVPASATASPSASDSLSEDASPPESSLSSEEEGELLTGSSTFDNLAVLQKTELELFADLEIKPGRFNFFPTTSQTQGKGSAPSAFEQLVIPSVTMKARHLSTLGFIGRGGDKKTHVEIVVLPSSTKLFPPMTKYVDNMAQALAKRTSLIPNNFSDKLEASFPPREKTPIPTPSTASSESFSLLRDIASEGSKELTLFIRISKTTLELNCTPLAKVVCSFDVSQADLLFSFKSPLPEASKDVLGPLQSFSCLTVSLPLARVRINHAYSIGEQGDCLHSELRDLSLNASLMETHTPKVLRRNNIRAVKSSKPLPPSSQVAVVLDIRKVILNFNVRQYQDYIAFKKIWLTFPEFRPTPQPEAPMASNPKEPIAPVPPSESWATRRDLSLRFVVHIHDVSLLADLGQAIGKASVLFNSLNLVFAKGIPASFVLLRPQTITGGEQFINATVSLNTLSVNLEGRFEGVVHFEGIQVEVIAKDPSLVRVGEGVGGLFSMNESSFFLKHAKMDLKHNLQKILKLTIDSVLLMIKDVWTVPSELFKRGTASPSELPAWEINLEFIFKGIAGRISKETLPSILRLQERFEGLLTAKQPLDLISTRLSAIEKEQDTGRKKVLREKDKEKEKEKPSPLSKLVTYRSMEIMGCEIFPSARLDVRGANVMLAFFKYNLQDLDAALVTMDSFLLELSTQHVPLKLLPKGKVTAATRAREDGAAAVHQELTINVGETKVQKATFGKTMLKEEIVSEVQSARDIFVLPSSIMVMETWQVHGEPLVFYKFMSDFDGTVDITLNVGLYQYLKELGTLYTRALSTPASAAPTSTTPNPAEEAVPQQQKSPGLQGIKSPQSPEPPTSPQDENAEIEARHAAGDFEFQALVPLQLEPQLKALGEATPPLEKVLGWMGMDKKMIPSWTHAYLSANVEKALIILQENLTELGSKPN